MPIGPGLRLQVTSVNGVLEVRHAGNGEEDGPDTIAMQAPSERGS